MRTPTPSRSQAHRAASLPIALLSAALTLAAGLSTAADVASSFDGGPSEAYVVAEPGGNVEAAGFHATDALTGAATTLAAGRTPGQVGVTHSGAATYRIPLWMPPGVGDVELDLALVYNSRAGNGVLGQGWTLSGLSVITRCNRTVAQDGAVGGVRNDSGDRFCIDGMQLKLVSGTYGVAGSVYATEIDRFARIVASGSAGDGPASFTVTTRNGLIYEYGGTPDSRAQAGGLATVRTWALSQVRDRVGTGNRIQLSYDNDALPGAYTHGTQRVARISYPLTATGAGPFYEVLFNYSPRPASDVPMGYLAGAVLREPNKLDAITVQAIGNSTPIKSYRFSYVPAPHTERLRLTAVQECAATSCFRPTQFTYQTGSIGWQALRDAGATSSAEQRSYVADLNGDGRSDLIYPVSAGSGKVAWWVLQGTVDGFASPLSTGLVTTSATSTLIVGQFRGNGRAQFLVQQNGAWFVAGFQGESFFVDITGLAAGTEHSAADFDGDGLDDLVATTTTAPRAITVRRNTSSPTSTSQVLHFAPVAQTVYTEPSTRVLRTSPNPRIADFDGDGRADLLVITSNTLDRLTRQFVTVLRSNGFGVPVTAAPEDTVNLAWMIAIGDWNADGCSDVIQAHQIRISDCAGSFAKIDTQPTAATGDGHYTVLALDRDADGRTDLMYVDRATNTWHLITSTGEGASAPRPTGIAAPLATTWFIHDSDGDGLVDLGVRDTDNRLRYRRSAAPGQATDLLLTVTDGFGSSHGFSYVSIARSNHERQSGATFPEVDFQAPLYVVRELSSTDGSGATYHHRYTYAGARRHVQGRGFLGFARQRIVDTRTGLVTEDHAERSHPFTGMHVERTVYQPNGSTKISSWRSQLAQRVSGGAGHEQRVFAFVAQQARQQFELGGTLDGEAITETTTTFTYGDAYGNPTRVESATTDTDQTSPHVGKTWRSVATFGYANDTARWCLGMPVSSSATSTAPAQATMTRTAAFSVDTLACRLVEQVLEPVTPAEKVTATYGHDGCGNVTSVRIVGSLANGTAMSPRTTTLNYGARCQAPETVTNALGQSTSYQYRYDFGVATQTVDPNGLVTRWAYDEFGRRTLETTPDGTRTAWSYESCDRAPCWGTSDLRFVVYESRLGSDLSLVRSRQAFYDQHEQLRSDQYQRAGGIWTHVDLGYDSMGRMVRRTNPYSSTPTGHTTISFDPLGRVTAIQDHAASGAILRITGFGHAGRSLATTDALGHTRVELRDVTGRLRRVVDPLGAATRYDYDSHGNLSRVEDPIGGVSSGLYNARGFRTRWQDASAGLWTFKANSLNELTSWVDAKGQKFSASYDALGRPLTRVEPEGTSRYTWGTSAAARKIGRLASKTGLGYGESYDYDAAGRLSRRTIVTDQTYRYDYSYNSIGELDTLTYPASPVPAGQSAARVAVRYGYSFGEPVQIDDVTQPQQPRTLWRQVSTNELGLPSLESLAGGGAVSASTYDLTTGRLLERRSGRSGNPTASQNLLYAWDAKGNLTQRRDSNQGRVEVFEHDALDRVTGGRLDGQVNLGVSYDAAGNVRSKMGVGQYAYAGLPRPHLLTSAGSETFAHDANGNVVSRNGLAQQWASFNLPTVVRASGGRESQFSYGPDHQRWRQVATDASGTETTHYVGALLEKGTTSTTGLTHWRHYVPTPGGATAVIARDSAGRASTSYVLTDHLGSSDTLLDATGTPQAKLSYDAFGARRGADWRTGTSPDWSVIAGSTRQGFTGHEMVDSVGLVHMGGRVYDPRLGRFMSVDPVIASLRDPQVGHPYAYVGNRPLGETDSTGYSPDGCATVCGAIVIGAVKTALNFLFGGSEVIWRPGATAIPGQSAQGEANGICGAGTFSPVCAGSVLYAGAPPPESGGGPGTSSWVTESYEAENLRQLFIDLGRNTIEVLILSPAYGVRDTYRAAAAGDYAEAVVILSLTVCEVAKPCYALKGPLKAISRAARSVEPPPLHVTTVIGRVKDLKVLRAGEESLLPKLKPNLGSPKANWKRNAGVLRAHMSTRTPIRDASPDDQMGPFLNAERNLLRSQGWKYDKATGYWMPPK